MYYGDFNNAEDVFGHFQVSAEERQGIHILLAGYEIDGYEGSALVIFIRKGKFWLVTGSHCSCMGLEGQFDPEEISVEELRHYGERSQGGYFQGLNEQLLRIVNVVNKMDQTGKTAEEIQFYLTLALK